MLCISIDTFTNLKGFKFVSPVLFNFCRTPFEKRTVYATILRSFKERFQTSYLLGRLTIVINHLSVNPTKWSNTLKQFVGNLPTNCECV